MTARGVALRALQQLGKGRIERIAEGLAGADLEPRDAALAHELAHGVVRNERFLDFVLTALVDRRLPRDPRTLAALRLGAFQLLLLDGMPARAAVHETVDLLQRERAFANAVLRRLAERVESRAADPSRRDVEVSLSPERTLVLPPPGLGDALDAAALRHSLPDFLVARWRAAFGDLAAEGVAAASSAVPALFLRACGGRSGSDLAAMLASAGVRTSATAHARVVRCEAGAPLGTAAFRDGAFVVQDPTAVRAAEAVAAAPGMTVVDLCAAPGTKATLLAECVQPDGVVFAYDRDARRRERIAENAQRLGLQRTLRVVDDPRDLPQADAVLADVPCSNTGVLARRVEVRRRLTAATFLELAAVQAEILRQALALRRPGGVAVYSTCSIETEENQGVVAAVAGSTGLAAQELTLPVARTQDGGFYAVLAPNSGAGVPAPQRDG